MNNKPVYTVIGTPYSPLTRTITLGLRHKGLEYTQIPAAPHSSTAFSAHPFGYIPTLIIHGKQGEEEDIKLSESQAIVRYIDRMAPEPSLLLRPGRGFPLEEKMWELVSFAASFGVSIIEFRVVRPRMKAEWNQTEEEIRAMLEDGPLFELKRFLEVIEGLMAPEGYAFGDRLTWADLFLYPILSNLSTVPEWGLVSERLKAWKDKMELLPEVQATKAGTMSAGLKVRRPLWRTNGRIVLPKPAL